MIFLKMRKLCKQMFEGSKDYVYESNNLLLDVLGQFVDVDKVVEGVHEQYSHPAIWNIEVANKKSKEMDDRALGWLTYKIKRHREINMLLSEGRQLLLPLRNYYNDFESPALVPVRVFNDAMAGYYEALRRR